MQVSISQFSESFFLSEEASEEPGEWAPPSASETTTTMKQHLAVTADPREPHSDIEPETHAVVHASAHLKHSPPALTR